MKAESRNGLPVVLLLVLLLQDSVSNVAIAKFD